jgi:hypothetical protein
MVAPGAVARFDQFIKFNSRLRRLDTNGNLAIYYCTDVGPVYCTL